MPAYCNTCGHVMDRHRAAKHRKGAAPCGSPVKSGLCTCRGFVRIPPKKEDKPRPGRKNGPRRKVEDHMDAPPPKINE